MCSLNLLYNRLIHLVPNRIMTNYLLKIEIEHVGYGLLIEALSRQTYIYSNTPRRFKDENFCKDNKYAINNVKKLYEDSIHMCRKLATDNPYVYTLILADTILSYMQMHSLYTVSLN